MNAVVIATNKRGEIKMKYTKEQIETIKLCVKAIVKLLDTDGDNCQYYLNGVAVEGEYKTDRIVIEIFPCES